MNEQQFDYEKIITISNKCMKMLQELQRTGNGESYGHIVEKLLEDNYKKTKGEKK